MNRPLAAAATTPRLLIATDFDGTLAPIVARPDQARAPAAVVGSIRRGALLGQTHMAIVSGRSLDDLAARLGPLECVWLVGGHGAEVRGPGTSVAPADSTLILEAVAEPLRREAPEEHGFVHERKPTGIAVHFRRVAPEIARRAVPRIIDSIALPAGLRIRQGKMVIELMAVDTDKGRALQRLRHITGATAVVYLGDDATDEDAFRSLGPGDVAVKVGEPPTDAHFCVPTVDEAQRLVAELVEARAAWLAGVSALPIQDHSILTDQRTMAVVSPRGSVVWLCLPRVDGPAIFASLLDGPRAGYWSIEPGDRSAPIGQRYIGDSFTLETAWSTMRVRDYLDGSAGRAFQRAGRSDLVRIVEGHGVARISFCPRLDFGRLPTQIIAVDGGLVVEGTADPLVVHSPGVRWMVEPHNGVEVAVAEVDLDQGPIALEMRAGARSLAPPRVAETVRREQTERSWSSWACTLRLPSVALSQCRRSALILRALAYGPTGAILAAGTTSLPETAGGVRNWDYRFCWPRDAAVAAAALVRVGNTGVAMRYLDWLLGMVDRCAGPERLRPIYAVTGEELGPEAELSNLQGYRLSQPVRIGNAAAQQVQLDVFGPIVELVHLVAEAGAAVSPDHWRLVEAMALAVERSWGDPDHGIWEVRTEKRHHVHSRTMCWLALDRAVRLAEEFVAVRREGWERLRDRIRDDVLRHGYDPEQGGFVSAYDHREPDAAALLVGLSGLVDVADPRFVGTVDLVQRRLFDRGTVYRYRFDDAIAGPEGGFHLCSSWLAEALVRLGRCDEAMDIFEALCRAAGPTGLMSEQWCPIERTGLGNLAQAYSHAALINTAVALEKAGCVVRTPHAPASRRSP